MALTVLDITKPRYMRRGKCGQCGECCKNENCQHFAWLPLNGKAICLIHDRKDRPEKCKLFPANPPIVFKTCSYKFWDIWEKKMLKAGEI